MVQKDFLLDLDLYICGEVRLQKQPSRDTDNERFLRECENQACKILHSFLGVQQWRG